MIEKVISNRYRLISKEELDNRIKDIRNSEFNIKELLDEIKKYGSTKAVFCGHDHLNDFGVMCDGVLLGYMQPSGYGSYSMASKFGAEEKDWLQGYMILSLSPDGTFAYEHHRNSEFI